MLLLGVLQAQAAGGVAGAGSFDLLEQRVLDSAESSVTFSSLSTYAADYQHLQVRMAVRALATGDTDVALIRMNADTASNYARHTLYATGSNVLSFGAGSVNRIELFSTSGTTATANNFAAGVADILDPFETTKYTTTRALGGGTGFNVPLQLTSGLWMNTNAITSLELYTLSGFGWAIGSRFSLYGIKAA